MTRLSDLTTSPAARRARGELGTAWEYLLSAADQSARQLGAASRARGVIARRRATAAALALRGEQPSPWRWWAAGLATGVVAGAAVAAMAGLRVRLVARDDANTLAAQMAPSGAQGASPGATTDAAPSPAQRGPDAAESRPQAETTEPAAAESTAPPPADTTADGAGPRG